MKKNILILCAFFAFCFAKAQENKESSFGFTKGDVFVTGSFSNSVNGSENAKVIFKPSIGFFVSDNVSIIANYLIAKNGNNRSDGYGLGGAYNFNPEKQFSSHIGISGTTVTSTMEEMISGTLKSTNYKTSKISLGFGVKYFVSNHFAFVADVAFLNYSSDSIDGGTDVNSTTIGLNMSNIDLGLAYKF